MTAGTVTYGSATGRGVILAAVLGSGMVMLDGTVVNVALRTIGTDLDASLSQLQWISNAYLLALASLILLGGALGDRLGRRRIFVTGVVAFAAASAVCGLAPEPGTLIAARALQGVGGALLTPGSLAIIEAVFAPRTGVARSAPGPAWAASRPRSARSSAERWCSTPTGAGSSGSTSRSRRSR